MGAKDRIRAFFEANVGKVVTKEQLAQVAVVSEWARRVRELREDEGMQILSNVDRTDLKPGHYILISLDRVPRISHAIDARLRVRILERNGFTCQLCGAGAGEPDPENPTRKIRLHIDHEDPDGPSVESNLRAVCSRCNQGRSNLQLPRSSINLLAATRKASREDQLLVFEWLKRKYGDGE